MICDECKKNEAMHRGSRGGIRENLCCACHVRRGAAPADWHPDCMKAYREYQEEGHTMSRMNETDPEKVDLEIYRTNAFFTDLGIEYVGKQNRPGDFPLDMFRDIVTGSTFLRGEMESVLDLSKRIRKGHTNECS